jgi:hypothetical protein
MWPLQSQCWVLAASICWTQELHLKLLYYKHLHSALGPRGMQSCQNVTSCSCHSAGAKVYMMHCFTCLEANIFTQRWLRWCFVWCESARR